MMNTAPEYTKTVKGLNPDFNKHQIFVDIEPVSRIYSAFSGADSCFIEYMAFFFILFMSKNIQVFYMELNNKIKLYL